MVENRKKHRPNSHLITHCLFLSCVTLYVTTSVHYDSKQPDSETSKFPLSHELGSERSERASERMSVAERASEASRAEQANE